MSVELDIIYIMRSRPLRVGVDPFQSIPPPGRAFGIPARERAMRSLHIAAVATVISLAACAHESPSSRVVTGESQVTPGAPPPAATEPAPAAESRIAPQPAASAPGSAPEGPATDAPPSTAAPSAPAASSPPSQSGPEAPRSRPSKQAAGPNSAPGSPVPATAAAAGAVPSSKAATPPPLDLKGLEQRLRDTRAIGLFTKLSLKNQVDDLLAQFKAFHQGQSGITVGQLRQKYELLLMKVVTLLQDGDPALASAVSSSREAIWQVLTDPQKFAAVAYST